MNKSFTALAVLLLSAGLLMGTGCKSTKGTSATKEATISAAGLLDYMVKNQVKAKWFSGKAKLDFSGAGMNVSANATIKMLKDSVVWVSVRKFGFEVGRALVTRDSVYVINRFANEYTVKDLSYLQKNYNLPASLETLQQVILGNPYFTTRDLSAEITPQAFVLSGNGSMASEYHLSNPGMLLQRMAFSEAQAKRNMNMLLEEYGQTADKQNFSYLRRISVDSPETGKADISIKFSQVDINVPDDIQFEMPKGYKTMD